MVQRIQTVYLLLATMAVIACLCLSLGAFELNGMGADVHLSNFCTTDGDAQHNFMPIVLAILLLLSIPDTIIAIISYKNRQLQAKICLIGIVLMLLWYGYFAFTILQSSLDATFHIGWPSFLPLIAVVLIGLARRAILADEALVRAADRIR